MRVSLRKKFISLILLLGPSIAFADWIQIYQHGNEGGSSWRLYLPSPGSDYLSNINYWVGSVRRIGSQIQSKSGGVFYHGASSFRVWAADSGVTLYLFEGNHFDGRMLRYHVPKGYTGVIYDSGWFNDRLGSFIAVREKEGQTDLEKLVDTPIPLDTMVSSIRTEISNKISADDDVEDFWLHDTQINYSTAHSMWTEIGEATSYWAKYYDIIRIKQEIEIDPNWWPSNYDTWMKLGYYFDTDSANHLHFTWAAWAIWVESGTISGSVADGLEAAVSGDLVGTGNKIRDAIKTAVEAQAGVFAPIIWDDVKRVGWKIPCNNFNGSSGYSSPSPPFCWAAGSRKEMFPPTLILHHNATNP